MSQQFDAIFDNGVLKPLVSLSLADKTRVKVTVESESVEAVRLEARDEWEQRLVGLAKDCGVSLTDAAVSSEGLYE
jgi:predicted DNA-binding antitoxin AbrB/MazE fold protein